MATSKFRYVWETMIFRFARSVVPHFPRPAIIGLAHVTGRIGYSVAGRERRVARANLETVFPDASEIWVQSAAMKSFQTFALVLFDLFWFGRQSRRRIERFVDFDSSMEAVLNSVPAVAVTAHLGNWEVLGLAVALRGSPLISVAADLENPAVNRELNLMRQATGQKVLPRRGAVRGMLKALRGGESVGLLADQNTLPQNGGTYVDFFGLPVPVTRAPGILACRAGVPIIMAFCVPSDGGRYRAYVSESFDPRSEGMNDLDVAARIAAATEKEVSLNADKWLWSYKRWKYIPAGSDGALYPFYAKRAG
ncbi:MAG: lysophospholipid acyltransferase family protein [Verrucomicrobiota bacterium]